MPMGWLLRRCTGALAIPPIMCMATDGPPPRAQRLAEKGGI